MLLKSDYDGIIMQAASDYGVPFEWIKGVIGAESNFDPEAYRAEPQINDASYGLMQLLYRTARGLGYNGEATGLYDPETNIRLGAKYLADIMSRWGDDFSAVYSEYNSGNGRNYLTNPTVAAHVERAWNYVNAALTEGAGIIASNPGASGAFVLGIAALYFILARRRRHKKGASK